MRALSKNNQNNDKKEKDCNSLKKDEEKKNLYININPLSLQLKLALTFIDTKKEEYSYPPWITSIQKLKNNNIGIIIDKTYLSIYSLNTFKLIYSIEPTKNNEIISEDNYFRLLDFIELKNNDLLLWTSKIIIIYKQSKESYKLLQVINEFKQGTNYIEYDSDDDSETESYNLNSLHELRNGLLVSCNSYGLKFYSKNNDKYNLISKHKIEYNVENILEIKENNLILFQKKSKTHNTSCTLPPSCSIDNNYRVTLYNIKNKEEKILVQGIAYFDSFSRNYRNAFSKIKYIIKDKCLFISFPNLFYIYDISKNKELFKEKEINIKLLCNYYNDLILVKDLNDEKIKIYQFKDGILKLYSDFPFQDFKKIFRLYNNNFIIFSKNQVKLSEIKLNL
jgi:hypothetical protein